MKRRHPPINGALRTHVFFQIKQAGAGFCSCVLIHMLLEVHMERIEVVPVL
jgi:hypothetical protein